MADNQEILRLIEWAAKERWTDLRLNNKHLTSLPPEIEKLTTVTHLNLRGNLLTRLPPEIGKLTQLIRLDLSSNQLKSLPSEIANLTNLTTLNLIGTPTTNLLPGIAKLTNLRRLNVSSSQLTKLPDEISDLTNLTNLDLGSNQLTALGREIGKLTQLSSLILSFNQLTNIPPEIAQLTNLSSLNFSFNRLTSVCPDIARLSNLTKLDLSYNQLQSLPSEITELTNLNYLDLRNNQLSIPPETLANPSDVKAIFAAIAGLASGERLNEAKMLVVGDGKVGKSSVVERLIYGTFTPQKQTTLGVDINDEMKVYQSKVKGEGEPIKLNIWDFGGQEIQHSTHQFFLTTRSLYLLLVDARKGDQAGNLEYWLKLIESFGGDSPIIIVINQIDQLKGQRPLNLDRKALQYKYNIRNFIETSCESGDGIPELKAAIAHEVEQLKHVRDVWPREWTAIKRRLKGMKADYIPVEKYLEICSEENLIDEDLQRSLLGLLHDLGIVIRFPGDMEVINPRWVTQGVYGLLTSPELVKAQGQFALENVGRILALIPEGEKRYPSYTHRRLIDVMRHFELCFEFTDRPGHYLIPRHLHDSESNFPWDEADTLKFQYHYETLPDSIISRFIVRMNRHIKQQHCWKTGVFLESGEGDNLAKIKADLVDRIIFISINGKEKTQRAFLAIIRSAFEEINSNFKIEIEQKIPIPGFPEVLVSYEELLAHEEMNVPEIVVAKLRRKFSVNKLLEGVEDLNTRLERNELNSNKKGGSETQPRTFRIVVASPSDVQPERDALPSVIEEINRGVAADRGLHLVLARWETDTYPGFHLEGPQGLIDPILRISDCDLLIGIFWKRFGTPTADGTTGTEHEFNLAYEAWREKGSPQIFVYFNQKAYMPNSTAETEQSGRVLTFREKFSKEGLWCPYKGKNDFEKLVRNHLMNYIRSLPS